MITHFTDRTSIEEYISSCQVKRWFRTKKDDKGIVPKKQNINLVFGTWEHNFTEAIFNLARNQKTPVTKDQCKEIISNLSSPCADALMQSTDDSWPETLPYQINAVEHLNLWQALSYAWFLFEFSVLLRKCKILFVEQEINNIIYKGLDNNRLNEIQIILQSKPDAILQDIDTETIFTYSCKTTKQLGYFTNQMVNRDLQGYLEMWAANQFLLGIEAKKRAALIQIDGLMSQNNQKNLVGFLDKVIPDIKGKVVEYLRFIFLVKGKRNVQDDGTILRDNPYLYGYRRIIETDDNESHWEYAHSNKIPKAENKSGFGSLGKGWSKFYVATEYPGGTFQWIDDINAGVFQSEIINPINEVSVPEESIGREHQLEQTKNYCTQVELEFLHKIKHRMDLIPNTKSCTMPSLCDYAKICDYSGMKEDEVVNNMDKYFTPRVPHHELERLSYQDAAIT